jgi:integrase
MPRRKAGPRLYLDPRRKQWIIRDGPNFIRTGCAEKERVGAERHLAEYLGKKYQPERGPDPLIADVLLVYAQEHLPHTKAAGNAVYNINSLSRWFGGVRLSGISAAVCRKYASQRSPAAARRDLETLRAAAKYWAREYGPIAVVPSIVLPAKSEPRARWLTRVEAKRLRVAAMSVPHLYRFIVIGLLTGSRSGNILDLTWDQVDLTAGVMHRRAFGEAEDSRKKSPPVKMGRALTRLMRRWKRQDGDARLVIRFKGQAVSRIKRSWKEACERAGITGASPHTLRHTRATWLMQAGVDIWEAAGHLGMSPAMLQSVYGKHHPTFQSKAAEV